MKDAKPLAEYKKGKKGRQIRSAKDQNEVVNALPRNQTWTVKLPQGMADASFKWSKSDKENVVLDLSKLAQQLTLQVDINGTIYNTIFLVVSVTEAADQ